MAYKDKDKQREADRERQRRYRAERGRQAYPKGVTQGVTDSGRDKEGVTGSCAVDYRHNTTGVKPERTVKDLADEFVRNSPKRGKDIKCFADLPPDVQRTINMMSTVEGKIDPGRKSIRTAIAVSYQQMFPDRYHSTGVV